MKLTGEIPKGDQLITMDATDESSWNRIQQIEENSEYMRENIYKPWKWACFQKCCPEWLKKTAARVSQVKKAGKTKMKKIVNRVHVFSVG